MAGRLESHQPKFRHGQVLGWVPAQADGKQKLQNCYVRVWLIIYKRMP